MIRKSGCRFLRKACSNDRLKRDRDSTSSHRALARHLRLRPARTGDASHRRYGGPSPLQAPSREGQRTSLRGEVLAVLHREEDARAVVEAVAIGFGEIVNA